jgi:aryl-alcohol dehydrogenase-like predicted oxidoreductase
MRYRNFPGTDLTVSELGFGVWTLAAGWWGEFTDEQAVAMLHRAHDLGITLYDTADTYGNGRGDELLGKAFRGPPRRGGDRRQGGVRLLQPPRRAPRAAGDPARHVARVPPPEAVDKVLHRLGTDVVDVMMFHNVKAEHVANDEIWETFERLRDEGKIRHWGGALGPSNGFLFEGMDLIRERRAAALQVIDNILEPFPGQAFTRAAEETGSTGLMVRVTHSSGMLEGKYTEDTQFAKNDHRRHRPRSWLVNGLQKVEALRFLHEGRDMTIGQAALKWLLASPAVATTLPNIYDVEQLEEFAAAPDKPDLTEEDLARVRELQRTNFGVHEEHMRYKGTMQRDGAPAYAPPYRYEDDGYGEGTVEGRALAGAGD